jgi:hypothetical protein
LKVIERNKSNILTTAYATASASKTGKSRENLTVGLVMLVQISILNKTKRPH